MPGDRIVGILTPGEGITIYPIQSPALKDFDDEPERWLDVRWDIDESTPQRFPARIAVDSRQRAGLARPDRQVIAEHDGNIDNIRMIAPLARFHRVTIDLEVCDLKHLNASSRNCAQRRWSRGSSASTAERCVIAGLDPAIHHSRRRWMRGSRRARCSDDVESASRPCQSSAAAPWRQRRSRRHPAQCARRAASRSRARRAAAIEAGADGITAHLREDRRHIRDDDMARLKAEISKPLNFEMAATDEMLRIALATQTACGLPRAGAARGAHHRRRARRRRPAQRAGSRSSPSSTTPASASRCSSPPTRARSRWRRSCARR